MFIKNLVLIAFASTLFVGTQAQKINAAAPYAKMVSAEGLKKHLSIIASDEMEGRETGKEGQRKAAAYIEQQFKSLGLDHPKNMSGYQQFYPLNQDSLSSTSELMVNNVQATFGKDFITSLNLNQNGSFKGKEIVFVGYGIDADLYSD